MNDEKNIEEIILSHFGIISKVAFTYCNNIDDREDLQQEIIFQICKSFKSFKGNSKISTWMYRVAINTAISDIKKRKKLSTQQLSENHLNLSVESKPEMSDQQVLLKQAINLLDDADKSLVMLYMDDRSYQEISKIIGLSENLIAVRMHRVKKKLKETINGRERNKGTV